MVEKITVSNPGVRNPFNISRFKAQIEDSYHRGAHFNVTLTIPKGLSKNLDANTVNTVARLAGRLPLEIETANIPGFALATDENHRYGYGAFNLKPYAPIFDTVNMTVRSDSQGLVYGFFQSWMKLIVNYDMRFGIDNATGLGSGKYGAGTPYEVMYKSDYISQMTISAFPEQGGDATISTVLIDAFPIHLGNAQLDWSDPKILKFAVTVAFSSWYNDTALGESMTANNSTYTPPTNIG
jgi:hypothetical protein